MKLLPHQIDALERTKSFQRVAYYHDMGLGKTFVGAEKMHLLGNRTNLIICQKSKLKDWINHIIMYYPQYKIYDLTSSRYPEYFSCPDRKVGIINYELSFRRPELLKLSGVTMLLDESSMIQNENAKRTKFISKINCSAVILLSGTPVGGKYENLLSQIRLLGVNISKTLYWSRYIKYRIANFGGFPQKIVTGYKNVDSLKKLLHEHGADFLKTEDVLTLPAVRAYKLLSDTDPYYDTLLESNYLEIKDTVFEADNVLKKMLYLRELCSIVYCPDKRAKLKDLLDSTSSRVVIFYNWNIEFEHLVDMISDTRPVSVVNGKTKDLDSYDKYEDSITLVQYQAGAMGLNLQKSHIIIYISLPLSSELYEQSKKRIHRVGQQNNCLYYLLLCKDSIEQNIHKTLLKRQNYTEELFIQDYERKGI